MRLTSINKHKNKVRDSNIYSYNICIISKIAIPLQAKRGSETHSRTQTRRHSRQTDITPRKRSAAWGMRIPVRSRRHSRRTSPSIPKKILQFIIHTKRTEKAFKFFPHSHFPMMDLLVCNITLHFPSVFRAECASKIRFSPTLKSRKQFIACYPPYYYCFSPPAYNQLERHPD